MEELLGIHAMPRAMGLPILGSNVWESQTGLEFIDDGSLVDALAETGRQVLQQQPGDDNPWVEWTADNAVGDVLDGQTIHTWTGISRLKGYGSESPWIKTQALVPCAPTLLAQLLMDSKRIQSYNTESSTMTRKDLWVNLAGTASSKICRQSTLTTESTSLLHCRPVPQGNEKSIDNVNPSWLMVSRAVGGTAHGVSSAGSQVLFGVNLMEAVPGRPNFTRLTTISHIHNNDKQVDEVTCVQTAVKFIKNLRDLHAK